MSRLRNPWPNGYTINKNSPYGWRVHPITGKRTFHHGVDVAMPVGTTLKAPADGVVVHKGSGGSGGYTLILKHADDLYTVYYHLKQPSHLAKGAKVSLGDPIALSGNTGSSTGPHLHWECRNSRTWGDTRDPEPLLAQPVVEVAPEPTPEPEPTPKPKPEPRKPMSAELLRFFQIQRALKMIDRGK
jgi:murein DD-endopeptidase MepM/ murein hydrolase activator NlpD